MNRRLASAFGFTFALLFAPRLRLAQKLCSCRKHIQGEARLFGGI